MKTILAMIFAACAAQAGAQTVVGPYLRSDGTYVQPHIRSAPNDTRMDNYGARDNIYGNSNPYTGQRGSQRSELSTDSYTTTPSNPYARKRSYP